VPKNQTKGNKTTNKEKAMKDPQHISQSLQTIEGCLCFERKLETAILFREGQLLESSKLNSSLKKVRAHRKLLTKNLELRNKKLGRHQ